MVPALIIGSVLLFLFLLVFALRTFANGLRKLGQAEIDKHFAPSDVLLSETMAQSFGHQSKGPFQARGNGALALTKDELYFVMYVPLRETRIAISSIQAVTFVRSHLGKTQFVPLLHVRYIDKPAGVAGRETAVEEAIAWRVAQPEVWKHKLELLCGAKPAADVPTHTPVEDQN